MKRGILCVFLAAILLSFVGASENNSVNQQTDNQFFQKVIPSNFEVGDAQFAIQIYNDQNNTVENIAPIIYGQGFSTYQIIPVESLDSGQKGYVFVRGNFRSAGNITLTVIFGKETFLPTFNIVNSNEIDALQQAEKENQIKEARLNNLTSELNNLKENYNDLESLLSEKKDNNYDVSKINLNDAKSYLRTAESKILAKDVDNAQVNLRLAAEEMNYQKTLLDATKTISIWTRLKDNAVIFSALAGAILTFFALSELLKRKGVDVIKTVGTVSSKIKKKN